MEVLRRGIRNVRQWIVGQKRHRRRAELARVDRILWEGLAGIRVIDHDGIAILRQARKVPIPLCLSGNRAVGIVGSTTTDSIPSRRKERTLAPVKQSRNLQWRANKCACF